MKSKNRKSLKSFVSDVSALYKWRTSGYSAPSPFPVKIECLTRHSLPDTTWIETGTYVGDTAFALSKIAQHVYTIEPEPLLFERAIVRFSAVQNVDVVFGLSEEKLPMVLERVSGNVNLWLDGHFSEGVTHRGPVETPILEELNVIEGHLQRLNRVCVLVDDVRLFEPSRTSSSAYPPLDLLVDWARKNNLNWHIEHDIFVAKKL